MKSPIIAFFLLLSLCDQAQTKDVHIAFISDVHFGIKKAHFRNFPDSVTSKQVNEAMAKSIKTLGKLDYIIVTGDIANREEVPLQAASASWKQFTEVYGPLHIPLLLVAGNHDVSNAIGYPKEMSPKTDATSLVGIYNWMHPDHQIDTSHFKYESDGLNYSRDIAGLHFLFINIWPDSANRLWMEKDLAKIGAQTPVLIFAHDPPEGDKKHFTNPSHKDFNTTDKFENLLSEVYNPNYQLEFDEFLKKHPNIKGYFHGHNNYHEFYIYRGVDSTLSLPCFRADSPMKGKYSAKDEKLLSFDELIIHPRKHQMEIKEFLWNAGKKIKLGDSQVLQF